jgi:quinoprotein glucose dehydrogenase
VKRFVLLLAAVAAALAGTAALSAKNAGAPPPGEWRHYGSDLHGSRYSSLEQIGPENFRSLRLAWTWDSPDNAVLRKNPDLRTGPNEGTPIMVGGVLYTVTSLNQVAALDAATGKTLWLHHPGSRGNVHRGVAYWEDARKRNRRIFVATADSYLLALDAGTGKPVRSFGKDGRVDLTLGLRRPVDRKLVSVTSPPVVCGDVIVVGGSVDDFQDKREMPPGDVRGFDARTGKRLWTFHTVPQAGEFGNETWEDESWKYTGNTNVWTVMSYDPELDYVYLPVSTPTNDWYGGHRKGENLFAESLVCLEAKTGRRVWHFQIVHHGLWDYDLPCAPNLIDVTVDGKRVKAVAQVTKQAFCFVFDRVTGKPLWPVEERPVPSSTVPGERASPTQPFPTRPAPFDRQGVTLDDLIDYTPELRREAEEILKRDWVYGPLYTPPATRPTILMPGWVGGASWAGAAADPETGLLYVPSITNAMWLALEKPESPDTTVDYKIGPNGYRIAGPQGLPLFKGPYGRVTAIDLNTGEHRWTAVQGEGPRNHPALKHLNLPPLGIHHRTYVLTTKTLLLATQEGGWFNEETPTEPPVLRAFDKATGRLIGEVPLPAHPTGAPMTYLAGGKQYVAVPVGGSGKPAALAALSLGPAAGSGPPRAAARAAERDGEPAR